MPRLHVQVENLKVENDSLRRDLKGQEESHEEFRRKVLDGISHKDAELTRLRGEVEFLRRVVDVLIKIEEER